MSIVRIKSALYLQRADQIDFLRALPKYKGVAYLTAEDSVIYNRLDRSRDHPGYVKWKELTADAIKVLNITKDEVTELAQLALKGDKLSRAILSIMGGYE